MAMLFYVSGHGQYSDTELYSEEPNQIVMWTFDDPVMYLTTIIALWLSMGWLVVIVHYVDNGRAKLRIQIPLTWSKTNSVSGPGTVVVIPNAPT